MEVIARTADQRVYVVRAHDREYLALDVSIPEAAFPKTRHGYDLTSSLPMSDNDAFVTPKPGRAPALKAYAARHPENDCIKA